MIGFCSKAVADSEYNMIRLSRQVARKAPLAARGFASQEALDQASDELAYAKRLREIASDALRRDAAVIQRSNALIEETAERLNALCTLQCHSISCHSDRLND